MFPQLTLVLQSPSLHFHVTGHYYIHVTARKHKLLVFPHVDFLTFTRFCIVYPLVIFPLPLFGNTFRRTKQRLPFIQLSTNLNMAAKRKAANETALERRVRRKVEEAPKYVHYDRKSDVH